MLGSATTQNLMTLKNAVSTQTADVNTESLLLLDNADTVTTGSTKVDNAILVTNSGGITGGITDAIDASATEIDNALNMGANNIVGTTGNIDLTNFDVTGSSGNIVTAGTLAVNGDSITADGATLIINAAGNVDVQDALNADSITSDAGVSIAANNSYTGAGAVALYSAANTTLTVDSGTTGALSIGTGANAKAITIGNNDVATTLGITAGDEWNFSSAGVLTFTPSAAQTTAIVITDTDYTNALNIGDNNILGTTANIDLTNFDVVGSTGAITTAGDIAVNGGDITSTSTLNVNSATTNAITLDSGETGCS